MSDKRKLLGLRHKTTGVVSICHQDPYKKSAPNSLEFSVIASARHQFDSWTLF